MSRLGWHKIKQKIPELIAPIKYKHHFIKFRLFLYTAHTMEYCEFQFTLEIKERYSSGIFHTVVATDEGHVQNCWMTDVQKNV